MIDIAQTLTELTALPIHDRLRVVESLWDSIPADAGVEVSPEQRAELQRRIAAHERSPEQLLTWDEVLDRLRDSRWSSHFGIAPKSSRISMLGAGGMRSGPQGLVPTLSSSALRPWPGFSGIQSGSASMRTACDPFASAASPTSSTTASKARWSWYSPSCLGAAILRHGKGGYNQTLDQTADRIRWWLRVRGPPLISFPVLAQIPRARANVGLTPIVIGVVSALSHPNAAQTFHAWSPTCLRPEGGLKPGNAERSFLPEVACRRIVWGARPMRLLAEPPD